MDLRGGTEARDFSSWKPWQRCAPAWLSIFIWPRCRASLGRGGWPWINSEFHRLCDGIIGVCHRTHSVLAPLRIEPRALWTLGKHLIKGAIALSPLLTYACFISLWIFMSLCCFFCSPLSCLPLWQPALFFLVAMSKYLRKATFWLAV